MRRRKTWRRTLLVSIVVVPELFHLLGRGEGRGVGQVVSFPPAILASSLRGQSYPGNFVPPDTALRLARVTGMSADIWLGLQQDWDLWHAVRSSAAARIDELEPLPRERGNPRPSFIHGRNRRRRSN